MDLIFSNNGTSSADVVYGSKTFNSSTMIPVVITINSVGISYPTSYKLQMNVNGSWRDIASVSRNMGQPNSTITWVNPPIYVPYLVANYTELTKVTGFRAYLERNWDEWQTATVTATCKIWIEK